MKKLLIFLALVFGALSASSQELISPCAPNSDSAIEYTFKISSDTYPDDAAKLERQMAHYFKAMNYNIVPCPYGDEFSDFNVILTDPNTAIFRGVTTPFQSQKELFVSLVNYIAGVFEYPKRAGEATTVFRAKEGGYDNFRIPSVVTTRTGRIVAFAEARAFNRDQAENKLVAKYSDDWGVTWSDIVVVDDQGRASLNNPCTVVHGKRIMMLYNSYPPDVTEGSAAGAQKNYYVYSDDGGESWSTPRDITAQTMHPLAVSACSGPGAAIIVEGGPHHGRIVVPFNGNGNSRWFNYLVYSDDNGNNWNIANGLSYYGTNESQIVQISDTAFLVSARSHRNIGDTSYMAPDGWNPWNFSKVTRNRAQMRVTMRGDSVEWGMPQIREDLPDPTCQGAMIRTRDGALYMSNPASQHTYPIEGRPYAQTPPMRVNGTFRVSYDNGQSWDWAQQRIYGGRFTEFQYSALAEVGIGAVCLFETYPDIKMAYIYVEGRGAPHHYNRPINPKYKQSKLKAISSALRVR